MMAVHTRTISKGPVMMNIVRCFFVVCAYLFLLSLQIAGVGCLVDYPCAPSTHARGSIHTCGNVLTVENTDTFRDTDRDQKSRRVHQLAACREPVGGGLPGARGCVTPLWCRSSRIITACTGHGVGNTSGRIHVYIYCVIRLCVHCNNDIGWLHVVDMTSMLDDTISCREYLSLCVRLDCLLYIHTSTLCYASLAHDGTLVETCIYHVLFDQHTIGPLICYTAIHLCHNKCVYTITKRDSTRMKAYTVTILMIDIEVKMSCLIITMCIDTIFCVDLLYKYKPDSDVTLIHMVEFTNCITFLLLDMLRKMTYGICGSNALQFLLYFMLSMEIHLLWLRQYHPQDSTNAIHATTMYGPVIDHNLLQPTRLRMMMDCLTWILHQMQVVGDMTSLNTSVWTSKCRMCSELIIHVCIWPVMFQVVAFVGYHVIILSEVDSSIQLRSIHKTI